MRQRMQKEVYGSALLDKAETMRVHRVGNCPHCRQRPRDSLGAEVVRLPNIRQHNSLFGLPCVTIVLVFPGPVSHGFEMKCFAGLWKVELPRALR